MRRTFGLDFLALGKGKVRSQKVVSEGISVITGRHGVYRYRRVGDGDLDYDELV